MKRVTSKQKKSTGEEWLTTELSTHELLILKADFQTKAYY